MFKKSLKAVSILILLLVIAQTVFAKPRPTSYTSTEPTPPPKPAWLDAAENRAPGSTMAEAPQATPSPTPEATPEAEPTPVPQKKNLRVPILLYHHITDEYDPSLAISMITPSDFRKHMNAIKFRYTPISLRDYCNYVKCTDGSVTLPDNPIIVTFDDGYSSNYEIAYPILKELEIPATIFVVTDTVGARAGDGVVNYSHFTWEEAKIMQNSGIIDIQSHTASHAHVAELDANATVRELRKSKMMIENNLNKICDMIAFPYGSYNPVSVISARKAGYDVQLLVGDNTTSEDFEVNMTDDGLENLKRITVSGSMGNVDILELIRKAMALKK